MTGGPSRRGVLGAVAAAAAVPVFGDLPGRRELLFAGTWQGTQIYAARFDAARGTLTPIGPVGEAVANWVVAHPSRPVLYVASGEDGGIVYTYAVNRATGTLTRRGAGIRTDGGGTGGGGLSYLGIDRPSGTLLVANFEAGLTVALPIAEDGRLGPPASVVQDTGSGPTPRQDGPHVHHVVIAPSGRFALIADFGADRVFVHRFDRAIRVLAPAATDAYATAAGSGPRRVRFHPGGRTVYLLNELTADLQVLEWNPHHGRLTRRQSLPTGTPGFTGTKSAAELDTSHDGRFVYVSNRGEHTLVVYAADPRTGRLTLAQRVRSGGRTPWSFSIHPSGRWLFVANEASGTVALFAVDRQTGRLTDTGTSLSIPNPDCVTFGA